MRGAAAPRTPRLKRKDTLHAYRVAANATDLDFIADHCQREVQMMAEGGDNFRKARTPRAAMVTVVHRIEDALRI